MFRRALLPLLLCVLLASFVPAAPAPEVLAQPPARSALPAPAPALARPAPPVRTVPMPNVIPASIPAPAEALAAPLQDENDILMDNFNRLNSGYTLGQANTGQTWQNANSYQIASIVSNKAFIPGYHIETIPAAADGTLAATFVAGCNGQLIFRYRDGAHYYTVSTQGSYYKVTRRNGNYTDVVLEASTVPYANGDRVSVLLAGPFIGVLVNGVLAMDLTDSVFTKASTVGLTTGNCPSTFDDITMGLRALDGRQTRGPEDCLGCGLTNVSAQVFTPWPVNTRTGNFWTHATDLAVSSPGPELVWSRAYAS